MAVGVSLTILALWLVQGFGFASWLLPDLCRHSILRGVVAIWIGLALNVVSACNLYYVVGLTGEQLAWPLTIGLAVISIALAVWKSPRAGVRIDAFSWVVIALSLLATLLVLRPLLSHGELGFYYSNNGEFANYAAIADVVQFHDVATELVGPFPTVSREAVAGLPCAVIATLTGKATLWLIQPFAAAVAALAFASLGMVFRHVALGATRQGAVMLALVYAWAIVSAAAQTFWTLSFVSQYLRIALWFGTLVFLVETHEASRTIRSIGFAVGIAAMTCAYPDMFLPSVALLAAFELARVEPAWRARGRAAIEIGAAMVLALVLGNRLAYELLASKLLAGTAGGGWNIFGPHHPALGYLANLSGLSNPFSGPRSHHAITSTIALLLFAGGLAFAVARARREPSPTLRGLLHLGWIFFAGLALGFGLVAHWGDGNNYVVVKLVFGFGWLAYLAVGIALASLVRWRPQVFFVALAIVGVLWFGLARTGVRFTKSLKRAQRAAMFVESEATAVRAALRGRPVYVAAELYNYGIVGHFLVYDRDLFGARGQWPGAMFRYGGTVVQPYSPTTPVLVLGNYVDPKVTGTYHRTLTGRAFTFDEP